MDLRCEGLESPVWRACLMPDAEGVVALDGPGLVALEHLLLRAQADTRCRALVIVSDGAEFCRGMDLAALARGDDPAARHAAIAGFARCLTLLRELRAPSLCVVEGAATGGGVGLVAACDLVIASNVASFALPELLLGLIPAVVLPVIGERLGPVRARWLALSGEKLEASAAWHLGLVDEFGEDTSLLLAARLKRLLRSSPAAITRLRRFSAEIAGLPLAEALAAGVARTAADVEDPEVAAAVAGFLAGVAPPWFVRYRPGDRG
jgi:enoyl-CoA hydratase/carnithine racemase